MSRAVYEKYKKRNEYIKARQASNWKVRRECDSSIAKRGEIVKRFKIPDYRFKKSHKDEDYYVIKGDLLTWRYEKHFFIVRMEKYEYIDIEANKCVLKTWTVYRRA